MERAPGWRMGLEFHGCLCVLCVCVCVCERERERQREIEREREREWLVAWASQCLKFRSQPKQFPFSGEAVRARWLAVKYGGWERAGR